MKMSAALRTLALAAVAVVAVQAIGEPTLEQFEADSFLGPDPVTGPPSAKSAEPRDEAVHLFPEKAPSQAIADASGDADWAFVLGEDSTFAAAAPSAAPAAAPAAEGAASPSAAAPVAPAAAAEPTAAAPPAVSAPAACDKSAASLMALLLVCFVAFNMGLLYMMNYSDQQVQNYFYKLVCQCIAVFCAYLAQIAVFAVVQRGVVMNLMQLFASKTVHETKVVHETVTFMLLMGWFLAISALSWKGRGCKHDTHAVKAAMPDAAGFAAYDLVGLGQIAVAEAILAGGAQGQFGKAVAWYMVCPFLVFGLFVFLDLPARYLRRTLVQRDQVAAPAEAQVALTSHEHEPEWVEVAQDCQMDSAAMVIAFVLRQLVLLVCQGTIPNMAGLITCKEGFEAMEVFVVALILAQVGLAYLDNYLETHGGNSKIIDFLQIIAANAVAWCLLPLIFYLIQTNVEFPVNQRMMVAAFVTPFAVVLLIAVDRLSDKGIISLNFAVKLVGCIGLTTGLAWGDALISCIESVLQDDLIGLKVLTSIVARNPNSQQHLAESIVFFTLLFIILPGWKWYIVPPACEPLPSETETAKQEALALEAERTAGEA